MKPIRDQEEKVKAIFQGDKYIGEVSHFTFWNCDVNWDLIYLDGNVLLDGDALGGATICLSFDNGRFTNTACTFSNGNGIFSGQVPANTTLTFNVYGSYSDCGFIYYMEEIEPFSDDVTLNPINQMVLTMNNDLLNITGAMVDFYNNPISNDYAKIKVGLYTFYAYPDIGEIDFTFIY